MKKEYFCSKCGNAKEQHDMVSAYICRECHNEYHREYERQQRDGKAWIYVFYNTANEVIYVGSTCRRYRVHEHMKGYTHLNIDYDWMQDKQLDRIEYADVSDICHCKEQREYIERQYILENMSDKLLNKQIPNPLLRADQMEEIEYLIETELIYLDILEDNLQRKIVSSVGTQDTIDELNFKLS